MDTPAFMPYDSRGHPPQHIQRPMAHQYMVAPAYTNGPMTTLAAPQYPNQQAFAYVPYQSPPPSTPMGSPYKHEAPRMVGHDVEAARGMPYRRGSRQLNEGRMQSPSARSESQASTAHSVGSNPNANAKTITYNETIDPADRVNFETEVDELMKVIQQNEDDDDEKSMTCTPAQTPNAESSSGSQSPVSFGQPSTPAHTEPKPKKKWVCDGPNCNKRFVQKTHLDIHRRTHTGHKPYVCTKENCGLTFSQRGNLKTHMRRHTGEKPYACSICGKLFAQRGNVRSHEETHKGLKPFICRLDDCNKTFSQLGNMKTHQNNFHKETLHTLTSLFVKYARMGDVPEEHQELFEYFKVHYKNSNKGIKGRGKARTVAPKTKAEPSVSAAMAFPHLPMPNQHQAYVPGPANTMAAIPRHPSTGGYPMFEHHADHSGAAGMLYDDEQSRQMAFSDRLY
ncbi:finger protein AZF1 [Purpureocillium lilacinum]|uniref:Finger protein AZF1 n=3 Tax=Purpureocillium lilacinum TaxID=33203 RepID=A0A179GHV0_PURLI|nr:finger protein AZF1 [Purpureocillium lilacinum]OAQ77435.1 finger protein AZF1 [Purpureocillium lilacinum]OAQ85554.1 finger protein AZF1 [Purpureocillium lilacinum]GJN85912.1 zinc finger and SCAN domain-containing protein 5B [Purpureocillium lilacinum]